jgi:zinc protease
MVPIRLVLVCLFTFCSFAFASAEPMTGGVAVTRATLSNGLKIVVVRDPLAPVATTMLNYEIGSDDQTYAGQAHALEHMMFRGSDSLSQSQLADIAELLGGAWNADTQDEVTQYFFTAPAQYLDVLLRMEASRAKGLTLDHKDWAIERGAIENEVTQDDSDGEQKLFRNVTLKMFAGSKLGNDGLGTIDAFDHQIDSPQLRALYDAYYRPNNAIFVIVGDVDPTTAIDGVKKYFGAIPSGTLPARKPANLKPLESASLRFDSDKPFTIASLSYRFPGYRDADFAASQILEGVLSSQRADLYGLVAQGKAFHADFEDLDTHTSAGSAVALAYVPVSTKPDDALAALRGVLANYRAKGVPADLVEAEKQRAIAAAEYKANSVNGLAFQWSQAVAVEGRSSPDEILTAIRNVTVADVDRVLRRYVDPAHEIAAVASPAHPSAASAAGSGADGAANNENNPTLLHHDPLPDWAIAAFADVKAPVSTTAPVDATLANGMRLIVVPEHVSRTVVVTGRIASLEATQAPAGLDGIADVTKNLLPFGTTTYDRLGLRTQLDAISASVTPGTSFSLQTLSDHFERGVELLADEQLHPAFPAKAFAAVKAQELGSVQGVDASPDHAAEVALNRALYPAGDPIQRFATPATVAKVTPDDVTRFYGSVYRPDMTTVVVVGDIEPARAKAVFERYFGGWKANGPKPVVDLPVVPKNQPSVVLVPDAQRSQSQIRLVQVSPLSRSSRDYAALSVANASLGGGGSAILFHDVRDVHGLVYGVYSQLGFDKNRSTFAINYASDPQKILPAQALIMSDVKNLAANGLLPNDLVRGRVELVSQIPMRSASFTGIAQQLLTDVHFGLPLDQATIDAREEIAVTNDQIVAAVRRWIRPADFVRVIVGPGPT